MCLFQACRPDEEVGYWLLGKRSNGFPAIYTLTLNIQYFRNETKKCSVTKKKFCMYTVRKFVPWLDTFLPIIQIDGGVTNTPALLSQFL